MHITSVPQVRSGMPLGGLGTGSIELQPDGEFHFWQIHNPQIFSRDCRDIPHPDRGEKEAGSLSFYLTASMGQEKWLRRLGFGFPRCQDPEGEEYNDRMHSRIKTVQRIEYDAAFPVARLNYLDHALPVSCRLEAVCPFVPHDAKTSGTPGFFLTFTIQNTASLPVTVSLAAKVRSYFSGGLPLNSYEASGSEHSLSISSGSSSLTLSMSGSGLSAIPGDYSKYMDEYVSYGEFGVAEESWLFDLLQSGKLPVSSSEPSWRRMPLLPEGEVLALSEADVTGLLETARMHGFSRSILERVLAVRPDLMSSDEGRRSLLRCVMHNAGRLDSMGSWGDGALASCFTLNPGETVEVPVVLAWFFPGLYSASGQRVGHVYENWFSHARDAAIHLLRNRNAILQKVRLFSENLYHTSFDPVFADAVSIQLANLVKSSWWTKDDQFGIWEGLGSCGLHTTDVAYYGTFALATLFPELECSQMKMGARFQREDGRVHHFFTPDFSGVDNGFERVDMNSQFVLMVCRDYLCTGDSDFLRQMWPHVEKAIASLSLLDTDKDGLPDRDTHANTYDAWHFSGTSTFISVLFLAALQAAAFMAGQLGIPCTYGERFEHSRNQVDSLLFNGDYYDLWKDGEVTDRCCMTDQLSGEFYSRYIGLGGFLTDAHVDKALEAVYRYNYSQENGLINASYPPGEKATLYTYRNCQATANWSGVEYELAAFFLMTGHAKEGLDVVRNVDERYRRAGEPFNHSECGDHYYRPLSSFCLIQALSGMRVIPALRSVQIQNSLLQTDSHAPWISTTGFGQLKRLRDGWQITCLSGTLEADTLLVDHTRYPVSLFLHPGESFLFRTDRTPS